MKTLSLATILTLALPGLATAQLSLTYQIGGVPSVNGATLETLDEPSPTILTLTGNAYLVTGGTGFPGYNYTAPYYSGSTAAYFGEAPATGPDTTQYVAVESGGTATLNFSTPQRYLGFLWGSVDSGYNYVTFYDSSDNQIGQILASQLTGVADNGQGVDGTAYANIISTTPFSSVTFNTSGPQGDFSFEFDDIAYAQAVPEPATTTLTAAGLGLFALLLIRRKTQKTAK